MEDFDITLALNSQQLPARVHPYEQDDKTYYEVVTDNFTLTLFKDTMFTWATEGSSSLDADDIQSIGEQLLLR
ncbi:hypothetical protein GCM10027037_06220 [Mucilaginibacter koreensis]